MCLTVFFGRGEPPIANNMFQECKLSLQSSTKKLASARNLSHACNASVARDAMVALARSVK